MTLRKPSRPLLFMLGFAALAVVWRALFWPVSQGAYTDGILQVDCFRLGLSYWPPLYALMTRMVSWVPGLGLEGGGRLVSLLAGALVLIPLGALARRLFGLRAAIWTMALWLVSPIAHRWSLQLMTDMPMVALWTGSLAALLIAIECYLPGLFTYEGKLQEPNPVRGNQWLWLANMLGVLTILTRFQGIFLLPPLALAAWKLRSVARHQSTPMRPPWLSLAVWLVFPLWLMRRGLGPLTAHFEQIGQRAGSDPLFTLVHIYWYQFEEFFLWMPYFFTYGVFGFMVYGLLRTHWATARLRWTGWLMLYLAVCIVALQSVFSSFQSRYLLPLLPFVCLFAGHGLATLERHTQGGRWLFWGLCAPTLFFALGFSTLVAAFQGNPFYDIKQAGQYIEHELKPDPQVTLYCNEVYNQKIHGAKLDFWCRRDQPSKLVGSGPLMPGDLVVLSSAYGGRLAFVQQIEQLKAQGMIIVKRFARYGGAMLPDLMEEPGTHQNPLAMAFRYKKQYFETVIAQVPGQRPPEQNTQAQDTLEERPVLPRYSEKMDALVDEARQLSEQLQQAAETEVP